MARKRSEFSWERDEPVAVPLDVPEEGGRPERREHREAMRDLKDLANRLAGLTPGHRRTLPLSAETLDELDLLDAADGRVDRRRVLMRAKRMLGGEDLVRLEAALAGDTPAITRERELVGWRTRILAGGDPVIQRFVEAWPAADRPAIRAAAREAKGEGVAARAAQVRLLRCLREAVTTASVGEADTEE
jgi:ribosome-associated protein